MSNFEFHSKLGKNCIFYYSIRACLIVMYLVTAHSLGHNYLVMGQESSLTQVLEKRSHVHHCQGKHSVVYKKKQGKFVID